MRLVLNVLWSYVFFKRRSPGWALVEIGFLWAAVAATTVAFWKVCRMAALLLLPYLLWSSFAVLLNRYEKGRTSSKLPLSWVATGLLQPIAKEIMKPSLIAHSKSRRFLYSQCGCDPHGALVDLRPGSNPPHSNVRGFLPSSRDL
jgi:hypothetical protein